MVPINRNIDMVLINRNIDMVSMDRNIDMVSINRDIDMVLVIQIDQRCLWLNQHIFSITAGTQCSQVVPARCRDCSFEY